MKKDYYQNTNSNGNSRKKKVFPAVFTISLRYWQKFIENVGKCCKKYAKQKKMSKGG